MNRSIEVPPARESPSFTFIQRRIDAASKETQSIVKKTLVEAAGSRKASFLALARMLRSQPLKFTSVGELLKRDEDARTRSGQRVTQEVAQRDASAMRPDENSPSPLEWFFLIPGIDVAGAKKDWRRLCEMMDNIPSNQNDVDGALSLQNVIQNVMSDEPRTRAFILETYERTLKMNSKLGRPPVVYDIGCGPFPVLGITAAIASPDSKVVCIEKNPMTAEVARFIVEQFGFKNIEVITGDALNNVTRAGRANERIDLLITETFGSALFDEPGVQIFNKYREFLSSEGETIPLRARLSATLMPGNKGVTFKDGVRNERYTDGVVLNVDGSDLPVIPDSEWVKTQPPEIFMGSAEDAVIRGSLSIPSGMTLKEFDKQSFLLCICAELDLGGHTLAKYQSFPTFPLRLDIIKVPEEFIRDDVDPKQLEIRFAFTPGASSSVHVRHATVVKKAV